jgi:hypothetical protein
MQPSAKAPRRRPVVNKTSQHHNIKTSKCYSLALHCFCPLVHNATSRALPLLLSPRDLVSEEVSPSVCFSLHPATYCTHLTPASHPPHTQVISKRHLTPTPSSDTPHTPLTPSSHTPHTRRPSCFRTTFSFGHVSEYPGVPHSLHESNPLM